MKKIMSAYKCRFCGAIFYEPMQGCEWDADGGVISVHKNWQDPLRKTMHQCDEKRNGFADLVGFEVTVKLCDITNAIRREQEELDKRLEECKELERRGKNEQT